MASKIYIITEMNAVRVRKYPQMTLNPTHSFEVNSELFETLNIHQMKPVRPSPQQQVKWKQKRDRPAKEDTVGKDDITLKTNEPKESTRFTFPSRMNRQSALGDEHTDVRTKEGPRERVPLHPPMCYIIITDRKKQGQRSTPDDKTRSPVKNTENQDATTDVITTKTEHRHRFGHGKKPNSQERSAFNIRAHIRKGMEHPMRVVTITNTAPGNNNGEKQSGNLAPSSSWKIDPEGNNSKSPSVTAHNSGLSHNSRQVAFSNLKLRAKNSLMNGPATPLNQPMMANSIDVPEPSSVKPKVHHQKLSVPDLDRKHTQEFATGEVAVQQDSLDMPPAPASMPQEIHQPKCLGQTLYTNSLYRPSYDRTREQLATNSRNMERNRTFYFKTFKHSPYSLSLGKRKVSGFAGGVIGSGVDSGMYHNQFSPFKQSPTHQTGASQSRELGLTISTTFQRKCRKQTLKIETPHTVTSPENKLKIKNFKKAIDSSVERTTFLDPQMSVSKTNSKKVIRSDHTLGIQSLPQSRLQHREQEAHAREEHEDNENITKLQATTTTETDFSLTPGMGGQTICKFMSPINRLSKPHEVPRLRQGGLHYFKDKKREGIETSNKFKPLNMKELQLKHSNFQVPVTGGNGDISEHTTESRDRSFINRDNLNLPARLLNKRMKYASKYHMTDRARTKRDFRKTSPLLPKSSEQATRSKNEIPLDPSIILKKLYRIQRDLWRRYEEEWGRFSSNDHLRVQAPIPPNCKSLPLHVFLCKQEQSITDLRRSHIQTMDFLEFEEAYREAKRRLQLCSFRIYDESVFLAMKTELEEGYKIFLQSFKRGENSPEANTNQFVQKNSVIVENNSEQVDLPLLDSSDTRPTPQIGNDSVGNETNKSLLDILQGGESIAKPVEYLSIDNKHGMKMPTPVINSKGARPVSNMMADFTMTNDGTVTLQNPSVANTKGTAN